MSNKLQGRVWDMRNLGMDLKAPLLKMADHANDGGYCWPGQDTLAEKCDTSLRSIERAINYLDRLGIVERVRRRRRATQEYQLWIPEIPELIDWGPYVAKVKKDKDYRCGQHGWCDQDAPQVAGQTWIDVEADQSDQEPTSTSALPGGLDPPQDPTPMSWKPDTHVGQDPTPMSGSSEENLHEPSRTARAPSDDEALRGLALERAVTKGATNPEGLAKTILAEDRADLERELEMRRAAGLRRAAQSNCGQCDERGYTWYDLSGNPVPPDDPSANTSVACDHPGFEGVR